MGGKLYENPAFDSGRENSGKMSFSGCFEFGREIGKRVWFAEEPFGGTADSPERKRTRTQDSIDSTDIMREHPDYSPRVSFRRLISIASEETLSMTDVQDTKTIVDAVLKRIEDGTSLSPTERHALEVARALKDQSSRMTRKWTEDLHTLRDKKQSLDSQGKSMETDEGELLVLLERFNTVAPFMADRTNLGADGKYEIPEAALIPFKTAVDGILGIDEGARSQDQKDLVWVYDMLIAGDPLTEELEARRVALNTQATGALATPPTHAPLSADESLLLSALEMVNTHAPYGIAHPKAFTHLGRDWKEQVQKFDDKIYELQIGATSMSRQEVELIYQLNNKNFMGTQISTMDWMGYAKFDPDKFGEGFVGDQRRLHKADATPSANDADIASALGIIATNIKLIKETVQSQVGIQQDIMQTHLERMEAVPLDNLGREVRGLGRRMKRGIELSIGRASDTEKAVAIGGAVVLLGALLMSKNKYAEAFRKFTLGGGAGLAMLLAIDVGSGAFFNGKRLSQKALAAMKVIGDGVSDEFYRVFEANAQGNTQEEKRVEVGHLATLASMAQSNKFSELLTKYRAARGTTNEIHLDGVPDDGTIGDLKQKPSVVFFLAMDLFYRRYGKDIERWEAENDGKLPLASLTFMEILLEMVSEDKYYDEPEHPFYWFAEQVKKAGTAVGEWSLVMADRLGEYGSRFFGDKAQIQDYMGEIFDENIHGKVGLRESLIGVDLDEHVMRLPGGVRVTFREHYREKEQDKSPGREVNGFELWNPYTKDWRFFGLDDNNLNELMEYGKELVLDTAVNTMPNLVPPDKAEDAKVMREFRKNYGGKLMWNESEHTWYIPGFSLGEKTYKISDVTSNQPNVESGRENIFIDVGAPLDKGTFSIGFYRNEYYWNKERHNTEKLTDLQNTIERENFKRWVIDTYDLPFTVSDLRMSDDNWRALQESSVEDGTPVDHVELQVPSTTGNISLIGQANSAGVLEFNFNLPTDPDSREKAFRGMMAELVEVRFNNLLQYPDDVNETFFRSFDKIRWPWEYFEIGGTVDEGKWKENIRTKRDQTLDMIKSGVITPEDYDILVDMLDGLADFERDIERKIALDEEFSEVDFNGALLEIEMLGLPEEFKGEYNYLRTRLDQFYEFEDEKAFYEILSLYYDIASDKGEVSIDGVASNISALDLVESADPDEQAIGQRYLRLYSEKIIGHFNSGRRGGVFSKIRSTEVETLRSIIELEQSTASSIDSNHYPGIAEYYTAFAEDSPEQEKYLFLDDVYTIQRLWLQHMHTVTSPILSRFSWKRAGFEYQRMDRRHGYQNPNWPDVDPRIFANEGGTIKMPIIGTTLMKAFSFEYYDIIPRVLDTLGLYPDGLWENMLYPSWWNNRNDFKVESAILINKFIDDNIDNLPDSEEDYQSTLNGLNEDLVELWKKKLPPELIGEELEAAGAITSIQGDVTRGSEIDTDVDLSGVVDSAAWRLTKAMLQRAGLTLDDPITRQDVIDLFGGDMARVGGLVSGISRIVPSIQSLDDLVNFVNRAIASESSSGSSGGTGSTGGTGSSGGAGSTSGSGSSGSGSSSGDLGLPDVKSEGSGSGGVIIDVGPSDGSTPGDGDSGPPTE